MADTSEDLSREPLPLADADGVCAGELCVVFLVQHAGGIPVPARVDADIAAVALDVDAPEIDTLFGFPEVVDEPEVVVFVIGEEYVSLDAVASPAIRSPDQGVKPGIGWSHPEHLAVVAVSGIEDGDRLWIADLPLVRSVLEIVRKEVLARVGRSGSVDGQDEQKDQNPLKISLDLLRSDLQLQPGPLREQIEAARDLADNTMENIRLLARGLRPPELDAVGLNGTLEGFCREFADLTRLSIDYVGSEIPGLPDAVNISLYRFLQEALTNVAKHAQANRVQVKLRRHADTVSLWVVDDGCGFVPSVETPNSYYSKGIGLLGMRERFEVLGGRLEVRSRLGEGTRLVAYVPWEE